MESREFKNSLSIPASRFKPISDYEPGEHYQFLCKTQKLSAPGSSFDCNEKSWFIPGNNYTFPEYQDRLVQIEKMTGELFRFLDFINPKYRGYVFKGIEFIASEEVENTGSYRSMVEKDKRFAAKESLARNSSYKFYVLDSDTHLGNLLANKYQCVLGIDHNQGCDPVTGVMTDTPRKEPKYRELPKQSLTDYESFPWLESYVPMSWGWVPERQDNETDEVWQKRRAARKKEVMELAQDADFISEKHFAALQLNITHELQQKYFVDLRIENKEDHASLTSMFDSQFKEYNEILRCSASFHQYLQQKRLDALFIITYEVQRFFRKNKRYEKDTQIPMKSILQHFQKLLETTKQPPLNSDELAKWQEFVKNIETTSTIRQVEKYYLEHKMKRHAELAREDALEIVLTRFFAKWPENKERLNSFIKETLPGFATDNLDPFNFMLEYLIKKPRTFTSDFFIALQGCKDLSRDQLSQSALYAALARQTETLKLFVKNNPGLDLNICRPKNGNYIIHYLVDEEKPDLAFIRYLAEQAEPRVALNSKNAKGISPFMLALEKKNHELIDYFVNTCKLTSEEIIKAALFYISTNQSDRAKALLDSQEVNDIRIFAAACNFTNENIMQYLCEKYFPSRNAAVMPEIFIFHAMKNKQWNVARFCLSRFKEVDLTFESDGESILSLAALRKKWEFIDEFAKDTALLQRFKPTQLRNAFPVLAERAADKADTVMMENLLKVARELRSQSAKGVFFKDGLTRWVDKMESCLRKPTVSTTVSLVP